MVHVALCLSDPSGDYYKYALVTALSVLDNTKAPLTLHIVHDETFSDRARQAFTDICQRYGQTLVLHHAHAIPDAVSRNVPSFLGKGTLYKIMLYQLLSEERVLYLDCDIVCLCDVSTVFAQNISDCYCGVVKMGKKQGDQWSRKLGLHSDFCVNAGVLLMNLAKIRSEIADYAPRLFEIVRNKEIRIGDQGAMNIFFDGNPQAFYFLPEDYNYRTEQGDHSILPLQNYYGKIIHFAGKKPWEVFSHPALFYWKYYSMLFPEENVFAKLEQLAPYEYDELYSYMLREEGVRRWVNRLYESSKHGIWQTLVKRILGKTGKTKHA